MGRNSILCDDRNNHCFFFFSLPCSLAAASILLLIYLVNSLWVPTEISVIFIPCQMPQWPLPPWHQAREESRPPQGWKSSPYFHQKELTQEDLIGFHTPHQSHQLVFRKNIVLKSIFIFVSSNHILFHFSLPCT